MMPQREFDILVIGGGHAGIEAAWAAARLGAQTALITFQRAAIGRMSCNPAIGGIGKGQIVREIDALGGLMGIIADETGIQFRMLNRSKGPAVWAPRAQSDSAGYAAAALKHLEACRNLTIIAGGVESIETEADARTGDHVRARVIGVTLCDGSRLRAGAAVVAAGTFLNGLIHVGEQQTPGGRVGEAAAVGLSESLNRLGFTLGRLKTGTPARLQRDSIDYSPLVEQSGDPEPVPFSFMNDRLTVEQVPCWITYTNPAVHDLIRRNLHRAPMYSGQIQSEGPRYCPSIETKIVRFGDKDKHQVFLEPEGRDSPRIYLNGLSTSLPREIQAEMLRLIPGLENAQILQWAYAIEYDYLPPEQIDASLMTKAIAGLFLAGQINGTSGYEEAAGQGLLAGVNAVHYLKGKEPVIIGRDRGYIGVMIDDLVTRGIVEPYRMFTSRAEHRLILRYDNADERLTPLGREIGLVDDKRWERYINKSNKLRSLRLALDNTRYEGKTLREWLRRPEEDGKKFLDLNPDLKKFYDQPDVWATALAETKYAGYIARQHQIIEEMRTLEMEQIPEGFNYSDIKQLRFEARERWSAVRPHNVGQAARVSGIHPTDVTILMIELSRRRRISETG